MDEAEKRCKFVELLPHVKSFKGAHSNDKRIRLEPWQQFVVCVVYGWVNKKTGLRRFRSAYLECARKNAKTTMLAALCLAALTIDGELGAEVYAAATTRDQARVVFNIAKRMAQMEPNFRSEFGVSIYEHSISVDASGNRMEALSAEGSTLDGRNVHLAVLDELHAHKTRAVHDVLDSSLGSRSQPLIWKITTAGSDRGGVCYDVRLYIQKLLNTTLLAHDGMGYRVEGNCAVDETVFGIIYTLDDADVTDLFNETAWPKANPNFGISVDIDDMRRMADMAKKQTAALSEFATKRLNLWWGANTGWLNRIELDACVDPELTEEKFHGERCWIGLDAAFKRDLFAKVKIFTRDLDDVTHYYAFARHYSHTQMAEAEGNEHFAGWARDGWLRLSDGNVTDIEDVKEELCGSADANRGDLQRFDIAQIAYDPAQITPFASEMIDQGLPMVEVRPLVLNFSAPMKEIQELITAGRFHFNGDPVLSYCLSNVVCHVDAKSNVYPRKERESDKIDGAIALIMAMSRALLSRPDGPSYYETLAAEQATERARIAVEALAPTDVSEQAEEAPIEAIAPQPNLSYWEAVAMERLQKERDRSL